MLESVFAGILLIGFVLFIAQGYAQANSMDGHDFGRVLPDLDQRGLLRGYVYSGDLEGLESEIRLYGFGHSVQVCAPSGSCKGSMPVHENVWVTSYFLSGNDSFQPREVRLYAWKT